MNKARNSHVGSGMSLGGVLLVVFAVLKLTGVIDWPWVWVLSPIWIPFALALLVMLIISVLKSAEK